MTRYKKNDEVKIINNTVGHGFKNGEIVKITHVDKYYNYRTKKTIDEYVATSLKSGERYWIHNDDVTPTNVCKKLKIL